MFLILYAQEQNGHAASEEINEVDLARSREGEVNGEEPLKQKQPAKHVQEEDELPRVDPFPYEAQPPPPQQQQQQQEQEQQQQQQQQRQVNGDGGQQQQGFYPKPMQDYGSLLLSRQRKTILYAHFMRLHRLPLGWLPETGLKRTVQSEKASR